MIPEHTKGSLDRYILNGIPPGNFLHAVLSNDLFESFGRADETNIRAMFDIADYIYNKVPRCCWGSPEIIKEWLRLHREEPEQVKQAITIYEREQI